MKRLLISLGILVLCLVTLIGCGSPSTPTPTTVQPTAAQPTQVQPTMAQPTPAQPTAAQPTAAQPTAAQPTAAQPTPAKPTTSTAPTTGPLTGGNLRIIYNAGPRVLGYSQEQGPFDLFVLLGAVEKVMEYNDAQKLVPQLAETVNVDQTAKTITVRLKKGIKWHDGSECNADSIVWNYQQQVSIKRIGYINQWQSIEVTDNLTFVIHYTGSYNNQFLMGWLWSPPMFSKAAFEKAGGGDIEKSKAWARVNLSGTGPFKLAEYKRDDHLTLTRFDDYWGGKPLLDQITYVFIPESVTASTMMQAKQADWWLSSPVKDQADLEKKGLVRQSGGGAFTTILPNIVDPKSKWNNAKLRQAVEYAMDKPGISKALGFGYYKPMTMLAPEGAWGYDPTYPTRQYDPAKAKQTLADAGYPNGLKIKLLALQGNEDLATAVKRYLDAAGFTAEIDIADAGRYFGSLYGTGWEDLILAGGGLMGDFLAVIQTNFSDEPLTRMASWAAPPDLKALCIDSRTYPDEAGQIAATQKLVKLIADQALIIPLYQAPGGYVIQPYVHTSYLKQGGFTFYFKDYWMDKH